MISFRDRTYCAATECRHFRDCPSALTDEVELGAQKAGLPIARFLNPSTLYCYKPYESTTHCDHQAVD